MLAVERVYVALTPMSDENQRPDGLDGTMGSRIVVEHAAVGLGQWSFTDALRRVRELDTGEVTLRDRFHHDLPSLRRVVGVVALDEVNEAMLELLGASTQGELVARLPELVTKHSASLFAELIADVANGQRRIERAGTLSRLDGRPMRVAVGLVLLNDEPETAIVSLTDLERFGDGQVAQLEHDRRAQELERMSFEIDRLFYAVSHDLRAPLRGVANLAAWIEEDLADGKEEDVRQHVATLQGRVARMDDMLGAVLDYAKVGADEVEDLERIDVAALLSEIVADRGLVPESFEVTWGEMPTLVTQVSLLRGVLVGLIDNAAKHHDRDDGKVTITAEDTGDRWRFRLADDGPGIPTRYRERVFHLFATLRRRDEVEGSGMGLAIVQKIVVAQGGAIDVEDVEPRGSAFVFTWPKVSRVEPSDEPPASMRPGRLA